MFFTLGQRPCFLAATALTSHGWQEIIALDTSCLEFSTRSDGGFTSLYALASPCSGDAAARRAGLFGIRKAD